MIRVYARLLIVLALVAAAFVPTAEAGVLDPNVMKIVLHTATPQEQGFIDYVVARVDKGTLRWNWCRVRSSGQERSLARSFSTSNKA